MTGLLLNTELRSDQRGFVKIIRRSSDKLLTIINDILDFSKIESGKLELEQQPFDLQTCVEESLSLVASQAAEKSLKLAYSIASPTPSTIIGDAARLGQILVNLLSNAVKFTETGEVMVSVTAQQKRAGGAGGAGGDYEIQFAVKDTGIGIPQERMEKLFKSFSQVDSSISRRYGGTGLGLAICKQLTEIMGGRTWVESQVGQGSTFYFTLVAQASSFQLDSSEETIQAIPRLAEQLPLRILLAEDNRVNQQVALLTLEQLGYHADAVSNGLEVLQSLRRQPYNVVLMDIQMPEMDGLSTTRQIYQEWPPDRRPRIIALTAYATEDNWKQCLAVGMDDYISKPIQIAKLIRALSQCQPNKEGTGMRGRGDAENFSASSSLAPLDAKVLQSLRKMTGTRAAEVLPQLIDNYLEEAPQLLQAMRAAVVSGDTAALQQAAHTLRGTSATLGATHLSQLCKTLETMGSTSITAGALASVLLVEAEYETVKTALQMECQRG
jgi:CheY-like chemotaxis protein/HPt (histidine-containing phosphotransfer) domain-containing protein/urease gamma subunit